MLPPVPSGAFALFLDADGTLLDIAARPDGVVVPASLRRALAALDGRLSGALALVSGRTIADLDGLFAPLRLRACGVHGAEIRFDPHGSVRISPEFRHAPNTIMALRRIAGRYPDTLVEDKQFSVAVHFRAAPTAEPKLRSDLESFLNSAEGNGCRILPGHMVFEIKRSGFDKGTAIGAFLAQPPFRGRQPIFVGDDVTDLPGFERVLTEGGLAYSVTTQRLGTSGHFPDPAAVRRWLEEAAAVRE